VPEQSRSARRAAEAEASKGWWRRRRAAKKKRLARMSRRKRVARRVGIIVTWLLALLALVTTVLAFAVYSVVHVPAPDELQTNQTASVLYSDGSLMANIDGGQNRTIVPLSQVPDHVKWAVIAAEDRGFYSEPGISIKGTFRAAVNDVTGGSTQGGSTITQQYVKNAYLNSDQTLTRKLKELAISLKLSRQYSKDKILENYLNTIYFGRGAYGIEAASKAYFGISVDKLSIAQGALLAAVIKSPEYYDPAITPTASQGRWAYVVDGMVSIGKLTQSQRGVLKFPKTVTQKSAASSLDGPLGLVWTQVKKALSSDGIDPATINTKGLRIQTTIDKSAQAAAQKAVQDNFATLTPLQKKQKLRPALTAVNPSDGAVLAYYGNSNGNNFDYANGYRPPGSSFKPYTLATALNENLAGKKPSYAISSTYNGSFCVTISATKVCNDPSDQQYSGSSVRIDYAMKVSLNTVFDGLAQEVGPPNVRATALAAGIRKTDNDGKPTLQKANGQTSFGIGIGDADYAVRPLDQAVGFATIANGGVAHGSYFVSKVTDSSGHVLYQHQNRGARAFDGKVANDVGLTLKPIADWSGDALANGRESGAKTGTAGIETGPYAGQNSDAWMVGYTPQVSTAVWVGSGGTGPISNSNGDTVLSYNQEYGRDLPGKTWKEFMDTYLSGKPNLPLPTTQMITQGSNIKPTAAPPTTKPSSTAPKTTGPVTTAPRTTAPVTTSPSTSASTSTPASSPTACVSPLIGTSCPPPTPAPTPTAPGG
jgi:membrane peptidoglycan carboxypeptidase